MQESIKALGSTRQKAQKKIESDTPKDRDKKKKSKNRIQKVQKEVKEDDCR